MPSRTVCSAAGDLRALPCLRSRSDMHDCLPPAHFIRQRSFPSDLLPIECARICGYWDEDSYAPELPSPVMIACIDDCMNLHVIQQLFAISAAVAGTTRPMLTAAAVHSSHTCSDKHGCSCIVSALADTQEEAGTDIFADTNTLTFLRTNTMPAGIKYHEIARIRRRARFYLWNNDKLMRKLPDGSWREVPEPQVRQQLVSEIHVSTGHFGARRTAHLVRQRFWWVGLVDTVRAVVKQCHTCDRVHASLNGRNLELNPLPIMGLCYRWSCDLAGPFPLSKRGNVYVLVCVEHLSMWMECIPIPNKYASTVAYAFLHNVLSRFSAMAEVLTDGGSEFKGEFDLLLQQAHVDHRITSQACPWVNGRAERCVQTVKSSLRKMCDIEADKDDWDMQVPWILMGYRCSVQSSIRYSPYEILFARPPVIPSAYTELFSAALDFSDENLAADSIVHRAAAAQHSAVMAANNLLIAQHRDTERYRHVRSGKYEPRVVRFQTGDFVYRKQPAANTLFPSVGASIYRVVAVQQNGVVVLSGSDSATFKENMANLAPCHVQVDLAACADDLVPDAALPCEICHDPGRPDIMLLCDSCNAGYHTICLTPVLLHVPDGDWICPACTRAGVTLHDVQLRRSRTKEIRRANIKPAVNSIDPCRALDCRWCVRPASDTHPQAVWGQVQYLGEQTKPRCFVVRFSDTDIAGPMTITALKRTKWLQPPGATPTPA